MSQLSTEYAKNSNEENASFDMSAADLDGVPDDYLEARKKDGEDGVYTVTLKYPDYLPLMKLCRNEATRKRMEFAFNNRNNPENAKILEELVQLRAEQAELLGFPTHAHYVLDVRMAKSPEKVLPFLKDLADKMTPLWEKERDVRREAFFPPQSTLFMPF